MESSKNTDPDRAHSAPSTGPLAGVCVTEFGSFIAAPLMARTLADFGAEVIKVESPKGGDQNRSWGGKESGTSYSWFVQARNKKSVTCDLHHPKGQDLARSIAAKSDIVIENFRPGRIAAWGLGYEALHALNPRLVMVHISGYGQSGPYRDRAGFGSIAEAMGGARFLTAEPGRAPVRFGFPLADSVAAFHGAFAAVAALRHAERTGQGQEIDVALTEAILSMLDDTILEYSGTGEVRQPSGATADRVVPSGTYPCAADHGADNHLVQIGGNADSVFRRLMLAMGRRDIADHPEFSTNDGRVENREEIDGAITAWTRGRSYREVVATLNEHGVPCGPIYNAADIVVDPQFRARDAIVDVPIPEAGRALAMQGIMPRFSATPGAIRWTGPPLGSSNEEIYRGLLGLDQSELDALHQEGII